MVNTQIRVKDISMVFKNANGAATEALKNVSFDIGEGEFFSLVGPSGCGKSTMLRILCDLLKPTQGEVTVNRSTPREVRMNQQFGMVFQNAVLFDWRSVRKNICLPLEMQNMGLKEQRRRTDEMLELVGLQDYANHYPHQLSGGMQQRVGIARALALNPKILLMDEPFSALDEFTREKLNDDLLVIWKKTLKTIIFITHNIQEAVYLSDRVAVLSPHPGRLSALVDIPLPRPRTKEIRFSAQCTELVAHIRNCFEGV
ncbi:MAG: ABC transporter ATP-binding protein [Oscillospiraceae bacterium]